jgi:rhodanese-related sulfurtransferase
MTQEEFENLWEERDRNEVFFMDARVVRDAAPLAEKYPGRWHSIPQDQIAGRLEEIPTDRPVVLVCNTGLRSFEAQLALAAAGRTNTRSVLGGLSSARRLGMEF